MPLNIPTGSTNNISFGPARVFMKVWSAGAMVTPTDDVGFIGEDGVTLEMTSDKKNIQQGNPYLTEFSFVQAQSATISFTSIMYNFENFRLAMGAGTTTFSAAAETFAFGGNPLNTETAIKLQHEMAVTGNTLDVYAWKTQSESGFSIPFGSDEHGFDFSFRCIRSLTDWGGTSHPTTDQALLQIKRIK